MNPWWLLLIVPTCTGVGFWAGANTVGRGLAMIIYDENGRCRECRHKTPEHHSNCPIGRYGL